MAVQDEVPKSRITLTYKTEVDGEPAPVNLPLRLLMLGDFSGGTSKDRKLDLDERGIRSIDGSNMNDLMKDMDISLSMVVPNQISEDEESMRVNLKIDSMKAFSPEKIAEQIPQIRSLLLFKKLLEEIQSNVANKKEFAQLLSKLYSNPAALESLKEKLKAYESFKIPAPKPKILDPVEEEDAQ